MATGLLVYHIKLGAKAWGPLSHHWDITSAVLAVVFLLYHCTFREIFVVGTSQYHYDYYYYYYYYYYY